MATDRRKQVLYKPSICKPGWSRKPKIVSTPMWTGGWLCWYYLQQQTWEFQILLHLLGWRFTRCCKWVQFLQKTRYKCFSYFSIHVPICNSASLFSYISNISFEIAPANSPVDGDWAAWGQWTSCSRSCGDGARTRRRTCTSPPPSETGKNCDGSSTQIEKCRVKSCPAPSKSLDINV